jgi:hypothetical protein
MMPTNSNYYKVHRMNPNERKYYDEDKGCTLNSDCSICNKRIWCQEGIGTVYHGKQYIANKPPHRVMSVVTNDGLMCYECYRNKYGKD